MREYVVLAVGLGAILGLAAVAGGTAGTSGLQPGESLPAFQVIDVTGPNKEKSSLCYI
ncbi:MAG: hypothetical protein HY321_05795 [Armatimonadetes bacterium]|nr:hypothetical protein [Armatimonadota bacterium]